jgi:hypothetical protein
VTADGGHESLFIPAIRMELGGIPSGTLSTLMIADKGFLHSNWRADFDRRQRHLHGGYAAQEAVTGH